MGIIKLKLYFKVFEVICSSTLVPNIDIPYTAGVYLYIFCLTFESLLSRLHNFQLQSWIQCKVDKAHLDMSESFLQGIS